MSENAASPNASEALKKIVDGATDASAFQQALRDYQEQEAAAGAQSPAAAAPVPEHESRTPPQNLANSFYAVGYKGNSRIEVFEYDRDAFNQAVESYVKMGWAF